MTKTGLQTERNQLIDVAKGVGILLVVFAHINYIEPWQSIIYGFHIPLFFFLSGMTFRQDKYPNFWSFFKRRACTLLLPYLTFAVISAIGVFVSDLIFKGVENTSIWTMGRYLIQFVTARYSQAIQANVALWFVPCLFLLECIYYWLTKIQNQPVRALLIVVLVYFGWYTESSYCPWDFSVLPWNFSSACFAIGFYAIGHNFGNKVCTLISGEGKLPKKLFTLLIAILCFGIASIVAGYNGHVTMGSRELGNGFLFYLSGIMGTLGVLNIGQFLKKIPVLKFWGRTSFCIMATHLLVRRFILLSYERLLDGEIMTTYFSWKKSLVIFIVVMAISSIFSLVYAYIQNKVKQIRLKSGEVSN